MLHMQIWMTRVAYEGQIRTEPDEDQEKNRV